MELRSGIALLMQQFMALLKKNALLSWRNKRASFLQFFSSFFFIFLMFAIDKAMQAQYSSSTASKSITDPQPMGIASITPCEKKFFIKLPCYDLVWSGSDNPHFQTIVDRMMANNPGTPIPPSKVKSFKTKNEAEEWLYNNPMRCAAALHLMERNKGIIGYGIQTNSTRIPRRGQFEDPTGAFQLPLQINAEREIARYLIGAANFSWDVTSREFPHPAIDEALSAVGSMGPTFFLAVAMFNFVLQMSSLVAEKELKLRQAMNMMGLYDSAYWLSWLTWEGLITLLSSLFIVLFGMLFRFDFFLKNSFTVVFLLFFLFELDMTGFAFMLSAFIHRSSSATTMGFSIFIVGFVTQIVVQAGIPYGTDYSRLFRTLWSFFPPNPFAQGLIILSEATETPEDNGLSWSNRGKCAKDEDDCVMTINDIYIWLVVTFFLWFFLAIYFDNIIPNASGVRKPMFYFLNPSYWMGRGGDKDESSVLPQEHITPDDEDVLEEENTIKQQVKNGVVDENIAVQIRGLAKTYPGGLKIAC